MPSLHKISSITYDKLNRIQQPIADLPNPTQPYPPMSLVNFRIPRTQQVAKITRPRCFKRASQHGKPSAAACLSAVNLSLACSIVIYIPTRASRHVNLSSPQPRANQHPIAARQMRAQNCCKGVHGLVLTPRRQRTRHRLCDKERLSLLASLIRNGKVSLAHLFPSLGDAT